jgi:hypothetical protein
LGKGVKPDDEKRKWKIFYLEKQLKALSNYVQGNQFDPLVGGGKTRTTFQEALEHEGSKEKLQFAAKFLMKKIGKEKAEVLGEGEPGGEKKEETTQEEVVEDKYYEFNALFKTQEKVDEENIEDGKTEELATSDSLEAELDKIFKGERLEKGVGREIRGDELKEVTEKARDTKQGTSKNSGAIKPR